ncbi:MAG: response regulator [Abditibacteriota bacterium]|nr:response regulator [Abditibacteriota bacterium]
MNKPLPTPRKRVVWIPALLFVVLAAGVFFAFSFLNKKHAEEMNTAYLRDNTVRTAEELSAAITAGIGEINALGSVFTESLQSPEALTAHLKGLAKNTDFDYLEYASADGSRQNPAGKTPGEAGSEYVDLGLKGKSGVLSVFKGPQVPSDLIVFYSPVTHNGKVTGVIAGAYADHGRLARMLKAEYYGKPAVTYMCDKSGRIIAGSSGSASAKALYIFRLTMDKALQDKMDAALSAGSTITFDSGHNAAGGCLTKLPGHPYYLLQIFPPEAGAALLDGANRLVLWLIIFLTAVFAALLIHFVTFMRRSQKDLTEALKAARAASDAKSVFLFNMSHDIRTPMNAILGFTDKALKNAGDREVVIDSLTKVKQSGNYLLSAMNEILDMAKIESGEAMPDMTVCLLEECVRKAFGEYRQQAAEKEIEYTAELSEIADNYVFADCGKLRQILGHVLSNAVKYTGSGGSVRLEVRKPEGYRTGYGKYVFSVKDTGQGMSPEFVSHIFESFEKENTSTETGKPGAGLGMAIVKKLADMLEGEIDIKSEKGAGTEITITLELPLADKEEYVKFAGGTASSDGEDMLKGKRVLVVEDNELNREISCDILEEKGLVTDTAEDGAAAVELLKKKGAHSYDFILMDIQMPNMNGYQATRVIRRLPNGEKVPIIAVSANAFDEDRRQSLEAGMNAHLSKPINVEELIKTMKELM